MFWRRVTALPCCIFIMYSFACTSDFAVPGEAQVVCASTADCPSGWTCNAKVGRCVKTENIDSEAPAIQGELTLAPAILKKGGAAALAFTVSEELSKDPVVTVKVAGQDRPLTKAPASTGVKYVYTYAAAGDEPQRVASPITITLTDKSGNVAGNISGKSVMFDFVVPEVTKIAIDRPLLKAGAAATLSFSVSPDGAMYTKTCTGIGATFYQCDIALKKSVVPTQGPLDVRVSMMDIAGNVNPDALLSFKPGSGIAADTQKPAALTAVQNDKILYRRIPWGADATAGVKKFSVKTLDGQTGAVEPNATVIFWDAADTATAAEIGRTTADANGYFAEKEITRADRTAVYLSQVDGAGNLDGPTATPIKNHEWTATMGYKVPGSDYENPHQFAVTPIFATALEQDPVRTVEPVSADLARLGRIDADALIKAAEASWLQVNASGAKPGARYGHAMVFDAARGKVVLFGGHDTTYHQDTWEWDGKTGVWLDRTNAGARPGPRWGHGMAYDAGRGKVVLFGGNSQGIYVQDTWEWDGGTGQWQDRTPVGAMPAVRTAGALAYDQVTREVVLFGGWNGARLQDTWVWDGASGAWTERVVTGAKPSARYMHAMAFDKVQGKTVLFGGTDGAYRQDVWEWDGSARTWADRTPAGLKPSARYRHSMAFDASRGTVLVFGGNTGGAPFQDLWEWNGATGSWIDRTPAGTKPPARATFAMAFDIGRGKAVIFGGDDGVPRQDTWEWNGTASAWLSRATTGERPTARDSHAMAYDSLRGRAVLFGGLNSGTDTWEWDGGAQSSPGQLLRVTIAEAGIDSAAALKDVIAAFHSGGTGYPGGTVTHGVELLAWTIDRWEVVASNSSSASAPALARWSTTDPAAVKRHFYGNPTSISLAVTPVAPNGTGVGQVSVDYAEVTVAYRLP